MRMHELVYLVASIAPPQIYHSGGRRFFDLRLIDRRGIGGGSGFLSEVLLITVY